MRNWKPRALLASWVVWWTGLTLWGLRHAIGPIWRLSQEGGNGGSANVSFDDGVFHATIKEGTKAAWQGDVSFMTLILLVGIPPLILWAIWAWTRKRVDRDPDLLPYGEPIDLGRKRGQKKKIETNDIPNPFV